jgi:hypothetical protein
MRSLIATAILTLAATLVATPAGAQTTRVEIDVTGPHNPYCGAWQNGTWVPNGNCVDEAAPQTTTNGTTTTNTTVVVPPAQTTTTTTDTGRVSPDSRAWQTLHGTIIGVNGHLVTIQQANRTLVVNDSPALSRLASGRVATGRQVVMHGYWEGGTYYVTRFE